MVTVERDGPVTTVILDRPEARNAVDRATAEELAEAFRAFDADPEAAVGVLYGDHGHFCAGADLKAFAAGNFNRVEPEGDGPMGPTRMLLTKPVIAAIAGYAVAGGMELALWCDLRVMEEDATLGVFCRRWGIPLIDGGDDPPATADWDEPRARSDSHWSRGRGGGGASDGPGESRRPAWAGASGRRGAGARACELAKGLPA